MATKERCAHFKQIADLADDAPLSRPQVADLQQAAQAIGVRLLVLNIGDDRDLEPAFAGLVEQRAGALIVSASAFYFSDRTHR